MDATESRENAVPCGKNAIPMALKYIREHCDRDITLTEVAKAAWVSPTYFSRLFVHTTGIHLSEYLRRCRLERAKELLTSYSLSVKEIALASGFHSAAYFIKLFSAEYGMTPGEYRRSGGITD